MGIFDNIPRIKTLAFDYLDSSCYDNEKLVYKKIVNEVYNNYGTRCYYYIVDYNTSRDVIFGEDNDRYIIRKFPLQAYFNLPPHQDMVSMFGIEEMDDFKMYISKLQLSAASTLDCTDRYGETSGTFPMYAPMEGDLIRPNYSSEIYEILHIMDTEEQFHQDQHTWEVTVRKYRDLHFSISGTQSACMSAISAYTDQQDMFDIADFIDTIKTDVLVSGAPISANPDDPFGGW